MDITTTGGEGPVLEADVYKAGTLAARLTRTPEGVSFAYRADYLASSTTEHSAIATTLPLSDVPLLSPSGAVPPFFCRAPTRRAQTHLSSPAYQDVS